MKNFSIRLVSKSDKKILFNWTNDSEVRKWSFNQSAITFPNHEVWFDKVTKDRNIIIFIFENNNFPTGLVRFKKKNKDEFILNYLIGPNSRGKGMASIMLKMTINDIKSYWENINVFAYTLPDNIASIKSLEKAGFKLFSSNNNKKCYVYAIK